MNFFKKIYLYFYTKGKEANHQYVALALIGIFSFAIYYLIWHVIESAEVDSLFYRLAGFFICLFLSLEKYWPQKIRFFLPIYWYITLIYCFPFFFTFMVLKDPTSVPWIITEMTGIFFLMLLCDWFSIIMVLIIGMSAAIILYVLTTEQRQYPALFIETIPTYITVILAGSFLIYRKDKVDKEKLNSMNALIGTIAHELRTPLASIKLLSIGIKNYMPLLVQGFIKAQEKDLITDDIPTNVMTILEDVADRINEKIDQSHITIDLILSNIQKTNLNITALKELSMNECINRAIENYPFTEIQKSLIAYKIDKDFIFKGEEILFEHILFNLFKNSLYFIEKARKGNILIWITSNPNLNELHFKDTGYGIENKDLPYIFDNFFTKNCQHGTGIGLSFCKSVIQAFGGDIKCNSIKGEFTEFIMFFPIIKKTKKI